MPSRNSAPDTKHNVEMSVAIMLQQSNDLECRGGSGGPLRTGTLALLIIIFGRKASLSHGNRLDIAREIWGYRLLHAAVEDGADGR